MRGPVRGASFTYARAAVLASPVELSCPRLRARARACARVHERPRPLSVRPALRESLVKFHSLCVGARGGCLSVLQPRAPSSGRRAACPACARARARHMRPRPHAHLRERARALLQLGMPRRHVRVQCVALDHLLGALGRRAVTAQRRGRRGRFPGIRRAPSRPRPLRRNAEINSSRPRPLHAARDVHGGVARPRPRERASVTCHSYS